MAAGLMTVDEGKLAHSYHAYFYAPAIQPCPAL